MKASFLSVAAVIALVLLGSLACAPSTMDTTSDESGGGTLTGDDAPAQSGTLRVLVTDKPFPFEFIREARVIITRVEVRRAEFEDNDSDDDSDSDSDSDSDEFGDDDSNDDDSDSQDDAEDDSDDDDSDDDSDDDEDAFVTIFEGEWNFNLLDLQNGRTDLLADLEIPAGTYTQMRLIVTEGTVVLDDEAGTTFNLRVPSGEQSGIKLNFTFEVVANEETTLLLDIDLSRAFSAIPSGRIDDISTIREFRFHPSIAMRLINILDAGSISGTVTDFVGFPLGAVSITAYDGDDEVTSTSSDADGFYMLVGLHTADYRVEFSANGFEDLSVSPVAVMAGVATIDVDVSLTPTSPAPN